MLGHVAGEEVIEVRHVLGEAQPLGDIGGEPARAGTGTGTVDQGPWQGHAHLLVGRLAHGQILPRVGQIYRRRWSPASGSVLVYCMGVVMRGFRRCCPTTMSAPSASNREACGVRRDPPRFAWPESRCGVRRLLTCMPQRSVCGRRDRGNLPTSCSNLRAAYRSDIRRPKVVTQTGWTCWCHGPAVNGMSTARTTTTVTPLAVCGLRRAADL